LKFENYEMIFSKKLTGSDKNDLHTYWVLNKHPAFVVGVRLIMRAFLVFSSGLGALNVYATSFVYPSFEDEINCLEHRVAIVKVVDRGPTTYEDKRCGNIYTCQTVESIRGDGGFFKVYSEADELPIGEDEYFLAAVNWNPELPRRSSCYDDEGERTPCHGSLLDREIYIADDANWGVFKEQRIFRIIEPPKHTNIPGTWVTEDRDSILR
jgi:hypothetical protein